MRLPILRKLRDHLAHQSETLGAVTDVEQGLSYKNEGDLPPKTQFVSDTYFYGAARGYSSSEDSLSCFALTAPVWMNLDEGVVLRPRGGAIIGIPQVLCNHVRSSRCPWRICAAMDRNGLAVSSSFFAVRPRNCKISLEFLAAVINGSVANAFLYSNRSERSNSYPLVRSIPIPPATPAQVSEIEMAVRSYEEAVSPTRVPEPRLTDAELCMRFARIDALILELYQLPGELRGQLLRLFDGQDRLRVPFRYRLSEDLLDQALREKCPVRGAENPWLRFAGMWADDPTFGDFLDRIARIREKVGRP